ncbi:MAG: YggS family pyridoxal phosphate-dependent enzyme [Rhodospirillaceae bacterium]|nr:YggS family pyridoxal phosphate-dependent enzyme [Rhodospirillaceae bacterium]MBL6941369.1 YggS family pyridoxal phosphate-dependent enzyme [Rhodospirillales bacterium]
MTGENNNETDRTGNLQRVRAELTAAAQEVGRDPASVNLVAVSKTKPASAILPILAAGQRVFGENRVQEAAEKWPQLKRDYSDIRLHLIGPLQSNKVRQAVDLFDVIETVDRPKLARALARIMEETGIRPDCMIQVNTGEEDQKAGVKPLEADDFIALCRDQLKLPVRGLMCIPPVGDEPSLHFALLAQIAARNGLEQLSMGMSADYPVAVRFGATHVRVGTAIFGARE